MKAAINIARFTAADPFAGLPTGSAGDRIPGFVAVSSVVAVRRRRHRAGARTEAASQAVDARVNNSEGASVNTNLSQFVYANSHGFCHGQQGSRHSLSTTLIAQQDGDMQRDYWYSSARHPQDLLSAAEVGRVAGERAVRRQRARG